MVERREMMAGLVAAGVGGALAGCSPLSVLNRLTPSDGGVVQAVSGASFGPDPRQALDVWTPRQARAAPVLVFFYGGGWSSGRRQDYAFVAKAFASRGFVTVVPDYRLVPQVRYPAFVEDGAAAVRWAQTHIAAYGGDPDRLALMGHSAGAYIAAMLALDARWLKAAGAPPKTVKAWVGLSGPYDFYPFDVAASQAAFGQAPDGPSTQPINHVGPDAPPALLLTGDRDTTVRPRNTLALADKLRSAGDAVEVKVYPGLSHTDTLVALARLFRGKAPVLDDATAFLERVLAA